MSHHTIRLNEHGKRYISDMLRDGKTAEISTIGERQWKRNFLPLPAIKALTKAYNVTQYWQVEKRLVDSEILHNDGHIIGLAYASDFLPLSKFIPLDFDECWIANKALRYYERQWYKVREERFFKDQRDSLRRPWLCHHDGFRFAPCDDTFVFAYDVQKGTHHYIDGLFAGVSSIGEKTPIRYVNDVDADNRKLRLSFDDWGIIIDSIFIQSNGEMKVYMLADKMHIQWADRGMNTVTTGLSNKNLFEAMQGYLSWLKRDKESREYRDSMGNR